MSTIQQFLSGVSEALAGKNGQELQNYFLVEPPLSDIYSYLSTELRAEYPAGTKKELEEHCRTLLPDAWVGFESFLTTYLEYLRDVNVENLLETHQLLSNLVSQCIAALGNVSRGILMLPTCLSLSAILARLAVGLDQRPDLTAHLIQSVADDADESGPKRTLVERTAELLQRAFTICLTERSNNSNGIGRDDRPEGKKIGIYCFANLVLKLLFQCRKIRLASQIFANVGQQSPPLSSFPASQRVSYLFYLGRFTFANNQFYRAQKALQAAFDQCPVRFARQRKSILVYLLSANIVLGRFPSQRVLQTADASDIWGKFRPICEAIRKGDLSSFWQVFGGPDREWFLRKGLLLPLRNRCEMLVWRTLARKTFLLNGIHGGESRRASTFSISDLAVFAQYLERRSLESRQDVRIDPHLVAANGRIHTNQIFMSPLAGEKSDTYVDEDLETSEGLGPDSELTTLAIGDVEAILASLIDQGLLHGFLSRKQLRFAILGAKAIGPLSAGFPSVWEVENNRAAAQTEDGTVPGWVVSQTPLSSGIPSGALPRVSFSNGGRVVNLSGARPVGAPLT